MTKTSGFTGAISGFENTTGFEPVFMYLKKNQEDQFLIDSSVNALRGSDLKAVKSNMNEKMNGIPKMMRRTGSIFRARMVSGQDQQHSSTTPSQAFTVVSRICSRTPRLQIKLFDRVLIEGRSSPQPAKERCTNLLTYLFDHGAKFAFEPNQNKTNIEK